MEFMVVIPARFGSTRFPGKPLADIDGKPMIQHVYERALQAQAKAVIVATDDDRIASVVRSFGGRVCMTSSEHESGTERLAEVMQIEGIDESMPIVNVQGDEPHIPVPVITQVAQNLIANPQADMATLACQIDHHDELSNPNIVKVVMDRHGMALYFSRSVIPFDRAAYLTQSKELNTKYYRHIGIYAYRAGFIKQYVAMHASELEQIESLEQLRVLYHGGRIHVQQALVTPPPGIDTPQDLLNLQQV